MATLPTYCMFLDLRGAAPERNIMFDPGVHELLELLPSRVRNGANLGAKIIGRLTPRAAWVVNSNTLLPLTFPPVAHRASKRCKPILAG